MNTTMCKTLGAVAGLLALAACGGGGGGGGSPHSSIDWAVPDSARTQVDGARLDMTSDQIVAEANRLLKKANIVVPSDVYVADRNGSLSRFEVQCSGVVCTAGGYFSRLPTEATGEWRSVMSYRGIDMVQHRERVTDGDGGNVRSYWGVMEHGAFGIEAMESDAGDIGVVGYSFGDAPRSNPVTSGVWNGVMIGVGLNSGSTSVDGIMGDAGITVDVDVSGSPTVDVAFTKIRNLDTPSAPVRDMAWSGLALRDGAFDDGSAGNRIRGAFYGPDHKEIGGVFERDLFMGSFGAIRQP